MCLVRTCKLAGDGASRATSGKSSGPPGDIPTATIGDPAYFSRAREMASTQVQVTGVSPVQGGDQPLLQSPGLPG